MSRTDKKMVKEMSELWRRVAQTSGVPVTSIGAAEESEMWNAAVERALTELDIVAAESSGSSNESSNQNSVVKNTRKPRQPKVFSPRTAIIAAALTAACTVQMRRELTGTRAMAFVIQVPSVGWIRPVERYLRELDDKLLTVARDGSNRARDTSSVGSDEVSSALSRGKRVVGIAVNPEAILPSTLVTTADHIVKLTAPNGQVVRDAMRRCYSRGVPDKIDDSLVAGLELEDLVAVMRKGSRPSDVMKRLHNASRLRNNVSANERLPKLEDAIEFGAARTWGLALAQDFADYRAGRIKWADVSRGAVLHSDPGTGKSMFARILAQACGVPVVISSMGELFATSAGYLDSIIKAQRNVYSRAAALSPCILYWEELDGLPNRNTTSTSRNADWWMPIIEDFMCLLDSAIASREGICVIGSTNRIDAIDPAILRPGRLEVAIHIPRPDAAGIENILRFHLDGNLAGADLTGFATMLEGATGADIMLVVRNARRSARQAGRAMIEDDLIGAIIPPEDIPPAALRRMAVHEASHAVTALATGVGRVGFCRLRSGAAEAGRTTIANSSGDYQTAAAIENRVVVYLAGRVGERVFMGAVSDGAGSDLARATATIAALHISDGLGNQLVYRGDESQALREVRRDRRLRATVEKHLQQLHARAEALVGEHRDAIAAIADELAEKRFLSGEAIVAIMKRHPPKKPRPSGRVAKPARQ